MKTPTVLNCQEFEDNGSDKRKARGSKHQRLNAHEDKEEECLDELKNECKRKDLG